jgi:DNA-binding HxlR family transcriptional regulator
MLIMSNNTLPKCPTGTTVALIGNKWKLLILRDLQTGTKRFGELLNGIPEISQKVLTQNLRALEQDGIVIRTVYAEVPLRVEYSLSNLGESLKPIFEALDEWGTNYQKLYNNMSE